VSADTVARLLKEMNYSLKVNRKKIESNPKKVTPESKQKRNKQFMYINQVREKFTKQKDIIISTDAKKRELVGNFKNNGVIWCKDPKDVNVYDFPTLATGVFIPYGIYNPTSNIGVVVGGVSFNTAEFAVNAIEKWWTVEGQQFSNGKKSLLILADGGGSNGSKNKLWKLSIQNNLCNKHNLNVTVCHFPPGTSKYNPIEHRLFSEISKNWAGQPLGDYETILKYISTTKTKTGLRVQSFLDENIYCKGKKVSKEVEEQINIMHHDILPEWNYTIFPMKSDLILR